jgi:hypothetical protein
MILLTELAQKEAPALAVLDVKTASLIGTAIGAGAYGLLSRSTWGIRRCLLKSHAMFVSGLVNKRNTAACKRSVWSGGHKRALAL